MSEIIDYEERKTMLEKTVNSVMSGLKDFQQATVNRIDQLFREDKHKITRVLVSDEVGLGKTLIAKGTVAKMALLRHEEKDDLFRVVYVCSNATIADQNLKKLRITADTILDDSYSSRLSMQHLNIFKQENSPDVLKKYIQLIPITPSTSFRMTSGRGTVQERALIFSILSNLHDRLFGKSIKISSLSAKLQGSVKKESWDYWCVLYQESVANCDKCSGGKYLEYMGEKLEAMFKENWSPEKSDSNMSFLNALIDCCNIQGECGYINRIICKLREIFACISVEKLEPDLVIMDEFQRFKYLISADKTTEMGMLADKFFNSKDARILLLSATPFKMYSTPEEIDETCIDEHYEEFLSVMKFLNYNAVDQNNFLTVWKDYSMKLAEFRLGNNTTVLEAKKLAEDAMYQNVCRTERKSAVENSDIIDSDDVKKSLEVEAADIQSYIIFQNLIKDIKLNRRIPVDFIKSTPYLMSFMRDYQLRRDIDRYFSLSRNNSDDSLRQINIGNLWINRDLISKYNPISYPNARLNYVMDKIFVHGIEKLLWMPASLPYYKPKGVYKNTEFLSKTIIFSSWEMVPRMIASLVSYESERRTVPEVFRGASYFDGYERISSGRLGFYLKDGDKPTAMTLFCLQYPSRFLTDCYNPIEFLNEGKDLKQIKVELGKKIREKLKSIQVKLKPNSRNLKADKRWYYIALFLLDSLDNKEYLQHWIDLSYDGTTDNKGYKKHLEFLENQIINGEYSLGKKPEDLVDVLTDIAIASPAVCINRTYNHYSTKPNTEIDYPGKFAQMFIERMNTVEAIAAIKMANKQDFGAWRNLLNYCRDGNLQAVLDEYAHQLSFGLDRDGDVVEQLYSCMQQAFEIKTTTYSIDTFESFKNKMQNRKNEAKDTRVNIRSHFAVAFTQGDSEKSDAARKQKIRNSFNSPFRPFVLASTSIGQEGLDFHNYCRRIVHWNLPSNPIDLEQREGRINRFKCLAIRQNIAKYYGNIHFNNDIWNEMFAKASEEIEHSSDLIPFWGLPETKDMVKIERIVPMYPFSRDEDAYERLIKILSSYRLTLGQARQEELLEYIFKNCKDPDDLKQLFINLSPFYKKRK